MDYKKDKGNKSNFDILASDLTKKERKDFLNKINPADIEIKIPTAEESRARMEAEDEKELAANTKKGAAHRLPSGPASPHARLFGSWQSRAPWQPHQKR